MGRYRRSHGSMMASESTLVLKIEEDSPSEYHSGEPPNWRCRIICHELGKTWENRVVADPFDRDEYDDCSKYLQCKPARQKDPLQVSIKLDSYRQKLFGYLKLGEVAQHIQNRSLEILICNRHTGDHTKSFHSLQWEQLEDLDSWSEYAHVEIPAVTVTRIKGSATRSEARISVCSENVFNILLVVARRNIFDRENDVPSPATIPCTILAIQEHLGRIGGLHDVDLEIVRPGSFKEFQEHLKRRRAGPLAKVYDAVHFDLHGGISDQKFAYLEFNQYNSRSGKLETTKIAAKDVAAELKDSNVKCAILNACKSATSDSGIFANLSCVFLDYGVRNVLGMSYDILDSTSEKFFYHFYREFVLNRRQLSESASHARRKLRDEPKRYNYESGVAVKIQDWFTPVVYSDGTPFRITCPDRIDKKMQAKFRPWLRKLKLKVQHALAFFLSWVAVSWFAGPRITPNPHLFDRLSGGSDRILALLVRSCCYLFPAPLLLHMCQCHSHDQEGARFLDAIHKHRYDRKNILRIESNLKQGSRMIFFYAKKDITSNARPLLHFITDIWRRTNFVDRRVVVQAEWFIQRWDVDIDRLDYDSLKQSVLIWMRSLLYFLRLGLLRLWTKYHYCGTESRTVVILDNINVLGPSTHDTQPFHVQAQDRLEDWLRKHCTPKPGTAQPYLVLVGNASGGVTTDWFMSRFPRVTALMPLKMTEFVPESLLLKHKEEWGSPNIIQL